MTDTEQDSSQYRPFPAFVEWETSAINTSDFDRYMQMLKNAKATATSESLNEAILAATRYAAVDTGAIEGLYDVDRGFTRTIATQAAAWESVMESRGRHVRPAFEDALRAYEFVLDAATRAVEVSELWIKELHGIICHSQDTYTVYTPSGPQNRSLPRGEYKTMPNSPTLKGDRTHSYAPVADTVPEMQRLVEELRTEAFQAAHPLVQAAYSHYAYVCIHPFVDGNGRVARALASVYLYRTPGIPLIIFADQRNGYYDALEDADGGNPYPFIQFVAARVIDGIGIVRSMLQRTGPSLSSAVGGLNELFSSGVQNEDLHPATVRLRNLAVSEARKQLSSLALPPQLDVKATPGQLNSLTPPESYGSIGNDGGWFLTVSSDWPHVVKARTIISAFARTGSSAQSEMLMVASHAAESFNFVASASGLEVWLREIEPVETETLKLKLAAWVEARIAELLSEATRQARG